MGERVDFYHRFIGKSVVNILIWSVVSACFASIFAVIGGTHFDIFLNDPTRVTRLGRMINMSFDASNPKLFGTPYADISGDWTAIFEEWCPRSLRRPGNEG